MPRLVINSEFFLDLTEWQTLREQLLPGLLARQPALRAWSAGCHVGKEAYSLAILIEDSAPGQSHYLLATDRDNELLARARAGGPFTARDVDQVTPKLRRQYLRAGGPPFFVSAWLMGRITFRTHDLLTNAFESNFDLILYRNLEPFFTPTVNNALHRKFFAALRAGGVLFIGATDSLVGWREIGFRRHSSMLYQKP